MRLQTRLLLVGLALVLLGCLAMVLGVYTGWGGSPCDRALSDCSSYVARYEISHTIFYAGRVLVGLGIAFMIAAVVVLARRLVVGRKAQPASDTRKR